MRRFITRCVVAGTFVATVFSAPLALAAPAGGRPATESFSFPFHDHAPAGDLCDFEYRSHGTISGDIKEFMDPNGEVTHDMMHAVATITHLNVDTGDSLTERLVENSTHDLVNGSGSTVGIQWHLRDPAGGGVLTVSGRITYTLDPFEILTVTPRVDEFFDFPEVICAALGGAPAD
jgi:hypothetical protein